MNKSDALTLLGGTPTKAAAAIGCKTQAVSQWPDPLTPRIQDRVVAALMRMPSGKRTYQKYMQEKSQEKVIFPTVMGKTHE
jgi:hypothetical protein